MGDKWEYLKLISEGNAVFGTWLSADQGVRCQHGDGFSEMKALSELGKIGWEMVSAAPSFQPNKYRVLYFKRKLEQ